MDSGQNSLVESVTRIRGVEVYNIEQMTHGMIQRIPGLFEFHAIVKESGLQELLWRVIGGVPMSYHEIWKKFKRYLHDSCSTLKYRANYRVCVMIES